MNSTLLNLGHNVTYMRVFLCRNDSWQHRRNNETQRIKQLGGRSAAKPWDPKDKSGLPAEFTGKTTVQISGLGAGSRCKKDLKSSLAHDKYLADPQHGELHM